MPDDDNGPNDSMTLVQYQSEVRRDALNRKGSHTNKILPKKDRMKIEGSGSWWSGFLLLSSRS